MQLLRQPSSPLDPLAEERRPATVRTFLVAVLAMFALLTCGRGATAFADDTEEAAAAFLERMAGVDLDGHFTTERPTPDGIRTMPPRRDRYRIEGIRHIADDRYFVDARIRYRKADGDDVDFTLPVPVRLHFVQGTALLSVTDQSLPLMGSGFSARVVFDGDRYAGTWQHNAVGGHMWGRVEPIAEGDAAATTEPSEPEPAASKE